MGKRSLDRPSQSTIEPQDDIVLTAEEVNEALSFDEFAISGSVDDPFADYKREVERDVLEGSVAESFKKGDKENYSHGPVTDLLKALLKHSKFSSPDLEIKDNTYFNNFIINYHSYYYPIPISLQEFVTNCEITCEKNSPYESCNLTLRIPFDLAKKIFSADDGHPSPGGWLLIRNRYSKEGNNITEDLTRTLKDFDVNYEFERRAQSPAIFFGVVSNISWNIFSDTNGLFVCEINLLVNSFIHNLIYGEFMVQQSGVKDNIDEIVKGGAYYGKTVDEIVKQQNTYTFRAKPEIGAPESLPFVFSQSEYSAFLSQQRNYLIGRNYDSKYIKKDFQEFFNLIDADFRDPTSPTGFTKGKTLAMLPMGYVLYNMIKKLCYMYLPVSILAEPMDTETFKDMSARLFNAIGITEVDNYEQAISEIEKSIKLFILQGKKQGVSNEILRLMAGGFISILGYATGESPAFVDPNNPNNPIYSYAELLSLGAAQQQYERSSAQYSATPTQQDEDEQIRSRTYLRPTRSFSAKADLDRIRQELDDLINSNPYEIVAPLRLGDILHVATTKNHIPQDYELHAAMPWRELRDYDITKFINYYSGSQTIWGLLKATFQPDDEIFELFPTFIPMTESMYKFSKQSDKEAEYKKVVDTQQNHYGYFGPIRSSLNVGNPIWNLIGGIPTIVYRLKPTTPGHEISKEYINAYNKKLKESNLLIKQRPEMQYTTVTEDTVPMFEGEESVLEDTTEINPGGETVKKIKKIKKMISEFRDNSYGLLNDYRWNNTVKSIEEKKKASQYFDEYKLGKAKSQYAKDEFTDTYVQSQSHLTGYEIFLPPYISQNEIIQLSFNQSDAMRINGVYIDSAVTKNMNSVIKYSLAGKYVVEPESTFMHGLRKYENTYQFFYSTNNLFTDIKERMNWKINELLRQGKTVDQIVEENETLVTDFYTKIIGKDKFNSTSRLSERYYMIIGDEQKYLSGSLRVIGNLLSDEIKPGLWIEVSLDESIDYPKLPNRRKQSTEIKSNMLFAYVDAVSVVWNVDQNNGNVTSETIISFSRGSFGRIMPNFPTIDIYKRNNAQILKDYINREIQGTKETPVTPGGTFKGTASTIINNPLDNIQVEEPPVKLKQEQLYQLVKGNLQKNKLTQDEANELLGLDPAQGIPADTYQKLKDVYDTLTDDEKTQVKDAIKRLFP